MLGFVEPRISLITLGVADLAASRRFYEALGWQAHAMSGADVAFFQANGMVLGLFGRAALAEDAGVADGPAGFAGISLAYNARSEAEVDVVFAQALRAGARARKPPQKTFWGGYSGYFADPDGHLWEVAHNPGFRIDEHGNVHLPGGNGPATLPSSDAE